MNVLDIVFPSLFVISGNNLVITCGGIGGSGENTERISWLEDQSVKICNESYIYHGHEFLVNTDNILPYTNVGIHCADIKIL